MNSARTVTPLPGDSGDGLLGLEPRQRLRLITLAQANSNNEVLRLRAQIVVGWLEGESGDESARRLHTTRRTVSKWRTRFREGGVDSLRDRPRPGVPRQLSERTISEVLRLHAQQSAGGPPWTTRRIAAHTGVSQSTVVRITRRRGS